MTGQSARIYRERKGLALTRRRIGRANFDPSANIVRSTPAITLPEHQLVERAFGSPDVVTLNSNWPNQELSSHD